jgi:dUTP pyrophosphatase
LSVPWRLFIKWSLPKRCNADCLPLPAVKIKVINRSTNPLPSYETSAAAGMDLRAFLDVSLTLEPMQRVLVPTGLFLELPIGFEAQVRPRSGVAWKKGLTVLNSPGTIDADYRGEIKVILVNLSNEIQTIENGERVAQMIIAKHETTQWEAVDALEETQRGAGGFGHTGVK